MGETVHILAYGRPLCGFSELPPGEWDAGHRWISFADARVAETCSCDACRSALERWRSRDRIT